MRNLSKLQRNSAILVAAELTSRALSFFAILWLMNDLGKAAYGPIAASLAMANLLVMFGDFGLSSYVTRLISTQPTAWRQQMGGLLFLKLGLSTVTTLAIIGILQVQQLSLAVVVWSTLAITFTSTRTFFEAIARGYQQMAKEFLSKLAHALMLIGMVVIGILQHWTVIEYAIGYGVVAILATLLAVVLLIPVWFTGQRNPNPISYRQLLIVLAPFGISLIINAQFNYLDAVVLSFFRSASEVAVYAAAYKPIFLITSIAGMIMNAAYPHIADLYQSNPAAAKQQIQRVLQGLGIMSAGVVLLGVAGNQLIIDLLYRADYATAATPFAILAVGVAGIYVWAGYGNSLQACGFEKDYTRNFIIAAVFNLIVTVLAVWQYGMVGAATATAATQLLLVVLMRNSYKQRL